MRGLVVMAFLALAAPCVAAAGDDDTQAVATAMPWTALSSEQQGLLKPFEDGWGNLPAERQQALARGSERWLRMSPDQRQQAKQRFNRWQQLTPEQRDRIRERWQQFQSLSPEEQQRVRDNFERFRDLTPEQRQQLRERWQRMIVLEADQLPPDAVLITAVLRARQEPGDSEEAQPAEEGCALNTGEITVLRFVVERHKRRAGVRLLTSVAEFR